jgi:DNA-binding response OmpR family regulator
MKKRIIIADDDPGIQDAFELVLRRAGYDVTVLPDGDSLVGDDWEHPDLIILDKQLPSIDGLDICRHLKSNDATKSIPVIMLSASPQVNTLAKDAGADEFLEKPLRKNDLLDTVSRYIG